MWKTKRFAQFAKPTIIATLAAATLLLAACAARVQPPQPISSIGGAPRIAIVDEWSAPPKQVWISSFFLYNERNEGETDLLLGARAMDYLMDRPALTGAEFETIDPDRWLGIVGDPTDFEWATTASGDRYQALPAEARTAVQKLGREQGIDFVIHLESGESGSGVMMTNQAVEHWGTVTRGSTQMQSQHAWYEALEVRVYAIDPPYYLGNGSEDLFGGVQPMMIDDGCEVDIGVEIYAACKDFIEAAVWDDVRPELDSAIRRLPVG
ncbi:hypothetical protein HFP89_09805 [Wenzhouxiangella sp. XN79A]|uniref:hypothetical protein n=1 Tax=Wenzhouxiangella sp. XN79A TaxID=2724193 RepID=UPI00144A7D8D|nr:hypothetical protein [Wenzhouxiangella sp. XN79A]NKI35461.1 hypothetical protein [Wenzhouxiangella sp. XN79A]